MKWYLHFLFKTINEMYQITARSIGNLEPWAGRPLLSGALLDKISEKVLKLMY